MPEPVFAKGHVRRNGFKIKSAVERSRKTNGSFERIIGEDRS